MELKSLPLKISRTSDPEDGSYWILLESFIFKDQLSWRPVAPGKITRQEREKQTELLSSYVA